MDVIAQIGAVRRSVRTVERDGETARVAEATQTYDAELTDVWDAMTNPERIPRWFLPISGDLQIGGRYALEGNASGTVLECEAPNRFLITWEYGGGVSWVQVALTADSDDRTTLVLEHTAVVPEEMWGEFGPGAVGVGWDLSLFGLASYLSGGTGGVTPEEAEAWSATDLGRSFMSRASSAWGEAWLSDGADPEQVHSAVDKTTAFYTVPPDPSAS